MVNNKSKIYNLDDNNVEVKVTDIQSSSEILKSLGRSLLAVNTSNNLHKTIQSIFAANERAMQDLIKGMRRFELPSMSIFPAMSQTPVLEIEEVTDDESVEKSRKRPTRLKLQPGFYLLRGNSFEYKKKILKSFSLDTQHGKLLLMFLQADGRFVGDELLLRTFNKDLIHDLSFILRNLKNKMKLNGLKIIIEKRKDPKGYVLVDIQQMRADQV